MDREDWRAVVQWVQRVRYDWANKLNVKNTIKNSIIWRLNNTLLNNQQITEEIRKETKICIFSVHFSRSVVSDTLQPHESQHTRLPCPSPNPEFTQTYVHWVSDAIHPSHLLSPPSPPALNLSQHEGLFQRVSSSHQVAKGLVPQLQHQSFQWMFRVDFL